MRKSRMKNTTKKKVGSMLHMEEEQSFLKKSHSPTPPPPLKELKLFELVHSVACSPMNEKTLDGSHYFMTFLLIIPRSCGFRH